MIPTVIYNFLIITIAIPDYIVAVIHAIVLRPRRGRDCSEIERLGGGARSSSIFSRNNCKLMLARARESTPSKDGTGMGRDESRARCRRREPGGLVARDPARVTGDDVALSDVKPSPALFRAPGRRARTRLREINASAFNVCVRRTPTRAHTASIWRTTGMIMRESAWLAVYTGEGLK